MTDKQCLISVLGRTLEYYNQNSVEWSHMYGEDGNREPMHVNGCGIFSLCHCAQWLTGREQPPEYWADTATRMGAVNELGTNRPKLLRGLMESGEAAALGFRYENNGLLDDTDRLFTFLEKQRGTAMGNIRAGHIVALVAARIKDGCKQVLVIDSMAESCEVLVRQHIYETVPGTEILASVQNSRGVKLGEVTAFGAYWVDAAAVRKYNLMHKI